MLIDATEDDDASLFRSADLRLCFRICRLLVFLCTGSYSIGVENRGYTSFAFCCAKTFNLTADTKSDGCSLYQQSVLNQYFI